MAPSHIESRDRTIRRRPSCPTGPAFPEALQTLVDQIERQLELELIVAAPPTTGPSWVPMAALGDPLDPEHLHQALDPAGRHAADVRLADHLDEGALGPRRSSSSQSGK
jgi:hypothetical protein